MTKEEQMAFVRELSNDVAEKICQKIENGKVPDSWDGIELRWLLAEYHSFQFRGTSWSTRKREFNNTVIVNNL